MSLRQFLVMTACALLFAVAGIAAPQSRSASANTTLVKRAHVRTTLDPTFSFGLHRVHLDLRLRRWAIPADFDPTTDTFRVMLGGATLFDSETESYSIVLRRRYCTILREHESGGLDRIRLDLRRGRVRVKLQPTRIRNFDEVTRDDFDVRIVLGETTFHAVFPFAYDTRTDTRRYRAPRRMRRPKGPSPGRAVSFRTLVVMENGGSGRGTESILTAQDWEAWWAERSFDPIPFVDFDSEQVLAVHLGGRGQLFHAIEVTNLIEQEDCLLVEYANTIPCGGAPDQASRPWTVIALAKGDYPPAALVRSETRCYHDR